MNTLMSEALVEFKMIFDILDWGDTGYLTAPQLSAIMRQYGYDNSDEEVQQMIDAVNTNGTGLMDFPTFCAALIASINITEPPRSP